MWVKKSMKSKMCIRDSQKAVENHVNGAVWAFDYDKMFCVLMENEICQKVCEKNKYNSCLLYTSRKCSCTIAETWI